MRRTALAAWAALLLPLAAWPFEQAFEAPAFVVSVPGAPPMQFTSEAPQRKAADALHASARNGALKVEVAAEPSASAGSTRTCAGAFLRDLVKRPGMPDRDNIYRSPFDASTFLVLYIIDTAGQRVLHAHLLGAAAGTHCIDAHFTKAMGTAEDEDTWRTTFNGARIRAVTR